MLCTQVLNIHVCVMSLCPMCLFSTFLCVICGGSRLSLLILFYILFFKCQIVQFFDYFVWTSPSTVVSLLRRSSWLGSPTAPDHLLCMMIFFVRGQNIPFGLPLLSLKSFAPFSLHVKRISEWLLLIMKFTILNECSLVKLARAITLKKKSSFDCYVEHR